MNTADLAGLLCVLGVVVVLGGGVVVALYGVRVTVDAVRGLMRGWIDGK